jgi:hypothetical protein
MSVCHTVIPEKVYGKEIQYHAASPGKKPQRARIFFGMCLFICDLFTSAYIALDDKIMNWNECRRIQLLHSLRYVLAFY